MLSNCKVQQAKAGLCVWAHMFVCACVCLCVLCVSVCALHTGKGEGGQCFLLALIAATDTGCLQPTTSERRGSGHRPVQASAASAAGLNRKIQGTGLQSLSLVMATNGGPLHPQSPGLCAGAMQGGAVQPMAACATWGCGGPHNTCHLGRALALEVLLRPNCG